MTKSEEFILKFNADFKARIERFGVHYDVAVYMLFQFHLAGIKDWSKDFTPADFQMRCCDTVEDLAIESLVDEFRAFVIYELEEMDGAA